MPLGNLIQFLHAAEGQLTCYSEALCSWQVIPKQRLGSDLQRESIEVLVHIPAASVLPPRGKHGICGVSHGLHCSNGRCFSYSYCKQEL